MVLLFSPNPRGTIWTDAFHRFFHNRIGNSTHQIKIRKFSAEGRLNEDVLLSIMSEEKPNQVEQWKIPKNRLKKYFPSGTTQQKMEETIIKALELYRKREKSRER